MRKIIISVFSVVSLICCNFIGVVGSDAAVNPSEVIATLAVGESMVVEKTVDTPEIPPKIDVCLLEDETASFSNDIVHLQAAASDIYDDVIAASPDAQFAVAGFRDYPTSPYGSPGDHVYRLLSGMSSSKTDWTNGIGLLTAAGGGDWPEAQYDAIVAAADVNVGCGWRDDPSVTRVLLVATDAAFHTPDGTHINNLASTVSALSVPGKEIIVIGLEAPDHNGNNPGSELDNLATATGGSVQALSSNGANIAAAILAGLGNLPITVTPFPVGCNPLAITFVPPFQTVTSGDPAIFDETIAVPNDPLLAGSSVLCAVEFRDENGNILGEQKISVEIPIAIDLNPDIAVNELGTPGQTHTVVASVTSDSALSSVVIPDTLVNFEVVSGPNSGKSGSENTNSAGDAKFTYEAKQGVLGLGMDVIEACVQGKDGRIVCDEVTKEWQDTTPPDVGCVETVNPSGKNIPPAGGKNGQNEDGFYQLIGEDAVDPEIMICVEDGESGILLGCYTDGTNVKYTEVASTPRVKPWGNIKSFVEWHLFGNGDMVIYATDSAGNVSDPVTCYVPPLPK